MGILDLPGEILVVIIELLRQLPPTQGLRLCSRHEYHQQDLVNLIQVNKHFFQIGVKILYTNPIVDNPYSFFLGITSPVQTPFSKIKCLEYVKCLNLEYRQNELCRYMEVYGDCFDEDRILYKQEIIDKGGEDLTNFSKTYKLLDRYRQVNRTQHDHILSKLEKLILGEYDGGWWSSQIPVLKRDWPHRNPEGITIGDEVQGRVSFHPRYDLIHSKYLDACKVLTILLNNINDAEIIQHIFRGPLSYCEVLKEQANQKDRLRSSTIYFNLVRSTSDSCCRPEIIPGTVNNWFMYADYRYTNNDWYEDDEGIPTHICYLLEDITMFRKPPVNPVLTPNCSLSPAPDQDQSTVLVIHNLNDLQKKSNETRHPDDRVTLLEEWLKILENPHHRTNLDPFPTRLSPKLDRNKEERFGPWGMMELASDDSASFVDIENSIESIVVRFIN